MYLSRLLFATLAFVVVLPCRAASAQRPSDSLEIGFRNPPASARPRTWWHWTASNVTKEGITKDLEWMKRVGIAGFQLADIAAGGGQTVPRKIVFGTPEWLDAVRHAAAEADRLALEMDIFASPGWSLTGGPWVKPAQAMKKLVWSDTIVQGPRHVSVMLPHPPTVNGPIRNLRRGGSATADPTFYGDDAVIAFRTPADERDLLALRPTVRTNAGAVDGSALLDDDLNTAQAALAEEVWGDLDGIDRTRRGYGAGMVVWGQSLSAVLAQAGIMPDVDFARPLDGEIAWIHRRTPDAEIYYITSSADRPLELDVRFRAGQREPEIWRPESGRIEAASYIVDSTRTRVHLSMTEHDAFFVVFRRGVEKESRVLPAVTRTTLATLDGPWRVAFAPGLGAPASIAMPQLASWTASADSGVKYFSGTATYTRTVRMPASWRGRRIMLSLGDVRDMAEVTVNGVKMPLLWKAPFETDVTGALRPGANQVEIRVTNEWTNRIIGDRAMPGRTVLSQGGPPPFGVRPQIPSPSGLLGPVRFMAIDAAR